ncbi:hypothetical protein L209DRAFT_757387 [Thermothelomyces heterothallicus CBS 203.75]
MSAAVNQLVKCLTSLAVASGEVADEYYIIRRSGPNLCQVSVTVNGAEDMGTAVTLDAKETSPALYLVARGASFVFGEADGEHERLVFYVDKSDHLRCTAWNDEEEFWDELEMNGLEAPMTVHSESQLSGATGSHDELWVVYQNPKLETVALARREGRWSTVGVVSADVPPGAAHVALADPKSVDRLNLFFATEKGEICHAYSDFVKREWTRAIVKNSLFPGGISRFTVVPTEPDGSYNIYGTTRDHKLFLLSSGGDRVELGRIDGDRFVGESRAERGWSFEINLGLFSFRLVLGADPGYLA